MKAKLYLAKIIAQEGKFSDALPLYNELIDTKSPIASVALVDKGYLLKEMKNYQEAITVFRQAIASGIDMPELRFNLGQCLEKAGQNTDAVEEYFKVIYMFSSEKNTVMPEGEKNYQVRSYFRIARIYEDDNNLSAAKAIYQKIIDLDTKESAIASARLKELEGK